MVRQAHKPRFMVKMLLLCLVFIFLPGLADEFFLLFARAFVRDVRGFQLFARAFLRHDPHFAVAVFAVFIGGVAL